MLSELPRKAQGGLPRLARPKLHDGIRLAADVADGIKPGSKDSDARVERVVRDALAQRKL
jgi:hypothetical protein